MSRPLRIQFPGAVYHVMNRGAAGQETFRRRADYEQFLKTLEEAHGLWGIEVFAYCLMGNHYHVCLRTPEGNLSRVMRHVDGVYTQRFNRAHQRDGPLFRGRYKAILIDAHEHLAAVVRYIHLNPVEAGLAKEPGAYPWSSHRFYLRPEKAPGWVKVTAVLESFGSAAEFHDFVLSGNEESFAAFYTARRKEPVLGSQQFLEQVRAVAKKFTRESPRYDLAAVRPTPQGVMKVVAEAYGADMRDLTAGRRGRENEARKVAMYLLKRCCDLTLEAIAEHFNVRSYKSAAWAYREVRDRMVAERKFTNRVERILRRIYPRAD